MEFRPVVKIALTKGRIHGSRARAHFLLWGILALLSILMISASSVQKKEKLDDSTDVYLTASQEIFLKVTPHRGDGYYHISQRYTGSKANAVAIKKLNGDRKQVLRGFSLTIPFDLLSDVWKASALKALYPGDRRVQRGWSHEVLNESLWRIAEWFTGDGKNYKLLREFNELATLNTKPGQTIVIPNALLIRSLRGVALPQESQDLEYKDQYALYKLKKGEALYTSVVVRFTGNVSAQDVNELAMEYARESGITDVTRIPVGYPIRIPYDDLLPQYLPEDHPRRLEWEEKILETADIATKIQAADLTGIHVILDSGHGGVDTGAIVGGVWESTYAYDILCRIKNLLESNTAAKVYPTILDEKRKYTIPDSDRLSQHKEQVLLTKPRYRLGNVKTGVNLRWYLANDIYRTIVKEGGDPEKVVFLSIHADALHPTIRGATAYIPGANYYDGSWGKGSGSYAQYDEVKRASSVSLSRDERLKYEALSRAFSRYLVENFTRSDLAVHKYGPIRESIVRRRRQWVPAVIRYNLVPTRILFEICNLNNEDDRKLLLTSDFRQAVAEAIVKSIMDYYGVVPDSEKLLALSASS